MISPAAAHAGRSIDQWAIYTGKAAPATQFGAEFPGADGSWPTFQTARPGLHQCNFAQAFPLWDIVFGTALYGEPPHATGVTDPAVDTDNDRGIVGQQWAALRRFWGAVWRRAGWHPGDVSFGPGYEPIPDARADRVIE